MKASTLDTNPVQALTVGRSGELRPMYGGRGISDMRSVSGEFLLSLQSLWRQRGDEILHRVADQYPELIFSGLIKLAKVTRIEVGSPGAFAKLGKADIVQKLEERGGPEARKLFEKFVADVEKLQAQQEQKDG